ncbi:hypothetical protein I6E61_03950 [Psychrobacter sp. NZS113]|uniref:hypothetical protein n=1 Tax=Psychrobacter sp. NZS113 TaxID=2792045 RepID=UPI0018CFB7F4|nr:hypothetical protein [Psychrobacter sp. NZS113]MBH0095535.1 hypothetical protein [Psychrobacter sp. NZS113]
MTIDNQLDQASETESEVVNTDGLVMQLDYAAPSQISQVNESSDSLAEAQTTEHTQHVALFAQLNRSEVNFHGKVKSSLVFRDSLLALFDVVSSDYRYVPKDRSAYTVFMQMRRASSNKNLFTAQRDYFTWLFDNDPLAFCILDPIIQVHEQGVSFEVFSRDEGCYAQLTLTNEIFEQSVEATLGTTSIDYSAALFNGIEKIRDHQQTILDIGHEAVGLQLLETMPETDNGEVNSTDAAASTNSAVATPTVKKQIIEKRINVPKSWIRALLQVQSAGQLPQDTIHLDPIALYNVLFELRMHADIKGKRRGLLIELRPQQLPVIILEPFDITVTSQVSQQQKPYQGQQAKLIRLWGRRRLSLLKRLLPHTDSVSVSLLGQGMPSYWTLKGKGFHFTFAMTGFSQANWSQSLNFDLLLPKRPQQNTISADRKQASAQVSEQVLESTDSGLVKVVDSLTHRPSTVDALTQQLTTQESELQSAPITEAQVRQWLLAGTQQGLIRYDIAQGSYYYRPLTQTPLDMAQFAYHNEAEKHAFDLIGRADAVQKFSVETVATKGVSISADVYVEEDRRTYHSQLQLGDEALVSRAECSCPQYLQHRLTQGVCAHLIALRLSYNNYDSTTAKNDSWHDTRILSQRVPVRHSIRHSTKATTQYKNEAITAPSDLVMDLSALSQPSEPSLDNKTDNIKESIKDKAIATTDETCITYIYLTIAHKKITIEQTTGDDSTHQHFVFNQPAQAKAAYLQHIARFEAKGFIENQGV